MTKLEKEEIVFEQPIRFKVLPVKGYDRFIPTDTTPSVANLETWVANNVIPITVTNFDNGANEQRIKILGDDFTTVANNATIKTSTGLDKLLAGNLIYVFTHINGVWYEDADLNSGGGGIGPQGATGSQGPVGVILDGKQGSMGMSFPGPQGIQGVAGVAGKNGVQGTVGMDGKNGQWGFPGPPGKDGITKTMLLVRG